MKLMVLSVVAVITLASAVSADVFSTAVLNAGDPPLAVAVEDGRILTVLNFVGNGNPASNLSVTKDGKSTPVLYPVDISIIGEKSTNVVVAGPATVTVTITSGSVLFSYRIDPNTRKFANHDN